MVLGHEHYLAIGRISVMYSDVETWTSIFIWQLIGPEQLVGQMVTAGMSFKRQVDLLTSLFRFRFSDEALRTQLEKHTNRLSKLEERRNAIMHSSWLLASADFNNATRFKITTKHNKGLAQSKEELTPAELNQIADDFRDALNDFTSFFIPIVSNIQYPGGSAK